MNLVVNVLIGLVLGYLVGVIFASIAAFVFGLEDAARFIAIGCALAGAVTGPSVLGRFREGI